MARSGKLRAGSRVRGYDIITLLGSGQFGEVYKAYDVTMDRILALKLIPVSDPAKHKANVEAQAHYLCSHDNVVKINYADDIASGADVCLIIDMEYIPEGSLEDAIQSRFVGAREAVYHIKQILFALEHAHNRGIVHRDVKPGNILLAKPRTKLSDFGTAIYPATGKKVLDLFYIPHAPPEALNNDDFSPLCDIYAAGLTLLRAINNIRDWSGLLSTMNWQSLAAEGRLVAKIGFENYVPRALRTLINRACNADTSKRYQSAAAFRGALEKLRFQNDWEKVSDDEWRCVMGSRTETIMIEKSPKSEIVYRINGRRQNALCKKFSEIRTARAYADEIVYNTTLI